MAATSHPSPAVSIGPLLPSPPRPPAAAAPPPHASRTKIWVVWDMKNYVFSCFVPPRRLKNLGFWSHTTQILLPRRLKFGRCRRPALFFFKLHRAPCGSNFSTPRQRFLQPAATPTVAPAFNAVSSSSSTPCRFFQAASRRPRSGSPAKTCIRFERPLLSCIPDFSQRSPTKALWK